MGLAVFYDPCSHCEHKDTKKMCNMCVLSYLRTCYQNEFVQQDNSSEIEKYWNKRIEEINEHVEKTFDGIKDKLGGQDEQGTSRA